MNILLVSQYYWPENFQINEISGELVKKNTVTVLTAQPSYNQRIKNRYFMPEIFFKNKIKIIRLPVFPRSQGMKISIVLNYISFFLSFFIFFIFLKKHLKHNDRIIAFGYSPLLQALPAIFLKKVYKIPAVLYLQDLWVENMIDTGVINSSIIIRILKNISQKIYKSFNLIIVQSPDFTKVLKNYSKDLRIKFLLNPSEKMYLIKKRKKYIKNSIKKIYFTGNLGYAFPIQDILKLVKFTKHMSYKIYLVGEGNQKEYIKDQIKLKRLQSKICLLNPIKKTKLKFLLKDSYAFLITLKKGYGLSKTIPGKLQYYLSFGKPIFSLCGGSIVDKIVNKYKIGIYSSNFKIDDNIQNMTYILNLSNSKKNLFRKNIISLNKQINIYNTTLKLSKIIKKL